MFKAKLINDQRYYNYRAFALVIFTIPPIVLSTLINLEKLSYWSILLIVVIYIVLMVLTLKFIKKMSAMVGIETIEIDQNEIRIKAKNSDKKEIIPLASIDKIILKKVYGIPQESMTDIAKELSGNPKENYIILQKGNEKRQFDFEIDSYYMITQLNKIIRYWDDTGYQIERVNQQ